MIFTDKEALKANGTYKYICFLLRVISSPDKDIL